MPTQACLGPAMHPWPERRGTAGDGCLETKKKKKEKKRRTAIKGTGDGGDDYLDTKEGRHDAEDGTVLVVDGMDTDDMDGCGVREH